MVFYIVIGIIAMILVYIYATYNSLVKTNNIAKEAFSTMDIYLKKRWDLIPNLVNVVKGYAKHEKDTLEEIIKLRNNIYDNMSTEEKINKNKLINQSINKIMALAENYPELKANENFLQLSKDLTSIEDEIAQSRKYYNAVVKNYNNKVEMIPSNIIAKIAGYKSKPMFSIENEERQNIQVEV